MVDLCPEISNYLVRNKSCTSNINFWESKMFLSIQELTTKNSGKENLNGIYIKNRKLGILVLLLPCV